MHRTYHVDRPQKKIELTDVVGRLPCNKSDESRRPKILLKGTVVFEDENNVVRAHKVRSTQITATRSDGSLIAATKA